MNSMKKILTFALALALTGAMATTVMAAAGDAPTDTGISNTQTEKVLLRANTSGNGQIAGTDDGSEPVGSDEFPLQTLAFNEDAGTVVKLVAIPEEGYKFVCWMNEDTQEICSQDAALTITLESPLTLIAVFDIDAERCIVKVDTYGEGQIVASDYDNEDPEFDDEYPMQSLVRNVIKGDTVTLKAKPDQGYKLMGWYNIDTLELLSQEETFVLTADKDYNIRAAFDLDAERHIIQVNTEGSGDIAYTDDGTEPEFDEYPYQSFYLNVAEGRTITLKARANEGFKFLCWLDKDTQDILSMEETYSFDVSKDQNIMAYFDPDVEKVLLRVNTEGNGQIAYSEDGADPEFDEDPMQSIAVNVIPGDSVVLKAKADEGWKFEGWKNVADGKIVSTEEAYNATVNEATELVAVFGLVEEDNDNGDDNSQNKDSDSEKDTTDNNGGNSQDNGGKSEQDTTGSNGGKSEQDTTGSNDDVAPFTPSTGDTTSAAALAAVAVASLGAIALGMKRRKEQE